MHPLLCLLLALPHGPAADAQPIRPAVHATGRVAFYTNAASIRPVDTAAVSTADFITNVNYAMPDAEGSGLEYAIDLRHSASSNATRPARVSIYDAYVGGRFLAGRARVRAGEVWLTDLGGLGALAGGVVEFKQPLHASRLGRLRIAGFGGFEPEPYQVGNVDGVRKVGAFGVLEGGAGRRHVLGYVHLVNHGLVERSVLTTTTFLPVHAKYFVYQAAEYDLVGPAKQGTGGLTYFMLNAHAAATDRIDLQGLYHRGRSIDTRAITDDILAGRPLRDGALTALLFASAGGRVSVRLTRTMRVDGGYTRDQNNRDSAPTGRVNLGGSTSDLAGSGVDVTVTGSRISRPNGRYSSLYLSAGRRAGARWYLSFDYSSSVSIVQFTRSDGITIETRPSTKQAGVSGIYNVGRHVAVTFTGERTSDQSVSDVRLLAGLTYRIR